MLTGRFVGARPERASGTAASPAAVPIRRRNSRLDGGLLAMCQRFHRRRKASTIAPVAPTGADDHDEQAERQVDSDDLADAVGAGARARPVLGVDGAFE